MDDQLTRVLTETFLTTVISTVPIVFFVFVLIRYLMRHYIEGKERSRYDDAMHEAVLSELRASYENRIAQLSREMIATRERWEDANHLLIAGQRNQNNVDIDKAINVDSFLNPFGIEQENVQIDEDKIFVLTPFSAEEGATFRSIKSVCLEAGFVVSRGDENRADGDILTQVVLGIISSRIIIANISTRNPNVFFELGIAMALGKPTLLLSDTISDVPFDLQSRRIIVFSGLDDLKMKLTRALLQTVRSKK